MAVGFRSYKGGLTRIIWVLQQARPSSGQKKRHLNEPGSADVIELLDSFGAHGGTRTRNLPGGGLTGRCVYQFRHVGQQRGAIRNPDGSEL